MNKCQHKKIQLFFLNVDYSKSTFRITKSTFIHPPTNKIIAFFLNVDICSWLLNNIQIMQSQSLMLMTKRRRTMYNNIVCVNNTAINITVSYFYQLQYVVLGFSTIEYVSIFLPLYLINLELII